MEKYIEKVIEIILDDVSCEHQEIEEFPRGPKHDDVTYCLNDPFGIVEKCIKAIPARLIERPEITDEWIKEKARELHDILWPDEKCKVPCTRQVKIREFLSSLFQDKARVAEDWIQGDPYE